MKNLAIAVLSLLLIAGCKKDKEETMDFTIEIKNDPSLNYKGNIYNTDGTPVKTYQGNNSHFIAKEEIPVMETVKVSFVITGNLDSTSKDKVIVIANGVELKANKIDTIRSVGTGGPIMQPCLLINGSIERK